jgi:hypothetical protein
MSIIELIPEPEGENHDECQETRRINKMLTVPSVSGIRFVSPHLKEEAMRHTLKIAFCIIILIVPFFGCGKRIVYLKGLPVKYQAETPVNKPGTGVKVYVAKAKDNRGKAENMEGHVIFVPVGDEDMTRAVTESVENCLSAYGFIVQDMDKAQAGQAAPGPSDKVLYTKVESLYNRRENGWVLTDIGTSRISFDIMEKDGTEPLWSKQVNNKAEVVSVWMATLADIEKAVNNAFGDSMKDFQAAISTPEFKNTQTGAAAEPTGSGK